MQCSVSYFKGFEVKNLTRKWKILKYEGYRMYVIIMWGNRVYINPLTLDFF